MKRGFTLIELLAVVGILALLGAIAFPVFSAAIDKGKQTSCASNLRQLFMATELYRQDCEGASLYGSATAMGLPPPAQFASLPLFGRLRCPDGKRAGDDATFGNGYFIYYPGPDSDPWRPTWAEYTTRFQDASILYGDPFHNPQSISLMWGEHVTRFCLGITVGGTFVHRRKRGDWEQPIWWN